MMRYVKKCVSGRFVRARNLMGCRCRIIARERCLSRVFAFFLVRRNSLRVDGRLEIIGEDAVRRDTVGACDLLGDR